MCVIKSLKSMKASSASRWVYSLRCLLEIEVNIISSDFLNNFEPACVAVDRERLSVCADQGAKYLPVLGTEAFLNTKHVPKTGKTCLQVELTTLSQECWLPIVI